MVQRQPAQPFEHAGKFTPVDAGLSPIGPQEPHSPDGIQHLAGLAWEKGGHAERHVVDSLGQDSAQPEHDHGPELGVTEEPCHKLPSAPHHALHHYPAHTPV